VILSKVDPATVALQVVAANSDKSPDLTVTSGTVRVYHLSALGAEVVDLAPTALIGTAAPLWRYVWQPVALAEGSYFVEYTLTVGAIDYAPIVESLSVIVSLADIADQVEMILKIERNNWLISGDELIIYDDNGITPLYTFSLTDKNGDPCTFSAARALNDVFRRVRS
jgi:hypothetical protein